MAELDRRSEEERTEEAFLEGPPPEATPVVLQQPVAYTQAPVQVEQPPAPPAPQRDAAERDREEAEAKLQLKIYSHSSLFYWWPVWAVGFLMALLSYGRGQQYAIGGNLEWFHPSSNLGVIFFLTLFLVIMITNVIVRGLASVIVILVISLATVLLAYFDLWDPILRWLGNLTVHLNMGAYVWFSALMFAVWASTVFFFDRMTYWTIKPGQITQEFVFGAGSKSYDTNGMTLEKYRGDIFRHWVLGLGSGDLHIHTTGASGERIDVPNVLFVGSKIGAIQRMIAVQPEKFGHATLK